MKTDQQNDDRQSNDRHSNDRPSNDLHDNDLQDPDTEQERAGLGRLLFAFVSKYLLGLILVSAVALIPCFWHPHIEAGDLASHSYNAWLASLVGQGKAAGLSIAPQTNNVLFDILLLRLGLILGFSAGEKIAVGAAVLVFLWGSFALASAAAKRPAWFLLPLLVMLSYGWTLQMGFFNFYLSLGLSCIGLAILWQARGLGYLYVVPVAALIWLAHPLGMAWFAGTALYIQAARFLKPSVQWILAPAALGAVFLVRLYLAAHYRVSWPNGHFYDLNGSDQLFLGARYQFLSLCLILAVVGSVLLHLVESHGATIANYFPLPLQLFVVAFLGVSLLPDSIFVPRFGEPVSLICSRFTLAVGILGACALANLRPKILVAVLTGAIAFAYFSFLYRDTAKTYSMERQAQALVSQIPQDARVIATIFPFRNSRIFVHHVVDRACIEHCFVVDNYEPASGQFRLRASAGNRIAAADSEAANRMMLGAYVVTPEDLPLWQIFQCGPWEVDLCLRSLQPGSLQTFTPGTIIRARKLD